MGGTVLGVDVGGTTIKAIAVDRDGRGRPLDAVPTPKDPTGAAVADVVAAYSAAVDADAIGVAVPGIVDDAAGVCRLSVNLGWRDVPVGELVAARTWHRPVAVTHDVRAGALAEWQLDRDGSLLFAPLGTGLAVAVIDADGRPIGTGWAGEVGQLVPQHGPGAGLRAEALASAGGLAARFGVQEAREVADLVRAHDPRAVAAWTETVDAVADVLAAAVALTAPTRIVVGGGLAASGALLLDPLRAALALRLPVFPPQRVETARLGSGAAAIGAAALAARHR